MLVFQSYKFQDICSQVFHIPLFFFYLAHPKECSKKSCGCPTMCCDHDILSARHTLKQSNILKRPRNSERSNLVRWHCGHVTVMKNDVPFRWPIHSCDAVEKRGFAGTIRADNTH